MDRFNPNISFADIFRTSRNIAVVGLSPKPDRPSHGVALYLKEQGFKIIPVNPNLDGPVLGEASYPDLLSVPYPIDIVDIYTEVKWYFPKIKSGQLLAVPLTKGPNPVCAYFVKDISRQCEQIDYGSVW